MVLLTSANGQAKADTQPAADQITTQAKQGYSWVNVINDHQDAEKINIMEKMINVGFYPNRPVIVHYVDDQGKPLANNDTISFNKNNPNQANNGVDPANNWYPEGEWQAKPKDIAGYTLQETEGATSGKFTSFAYNVTFVYSKSTPKPNPEPEPNPEPTPAPQPNPENPAKPGKTATVKPHAGVNKTVTSKQGQSTKAVKQATVQAQLPQTGAQKDSSSLIGLALATLAGLLGLGSRKRKND